MFTSRNGIGLGRPGEEIVSGEKKETIRDLEDSEGIIKALPNNSDSDGCHRRLTQRSVITWRFVCCRFADLSQTECERAVSFACQRGYLPAILRALLVPR